MRILLIVLFLLLSHPAQAKDESVYERVMAAGKIRCGYALYPPYMEKDPLTGKLSGIAYDAWNEMGKILNLTIEWNEEIQYADMITALNADRIDVLCTSVGITSRAAHADFLEPPYYVTTSLWVRANETRGEKEMNAPTVKIASVEGTSFDSFIPQYFPRAQIYPLPQSSPITDQMMVVATGKADATILDTWLAEQFSAANPGKVKKLGPSAFRVDAVAAMLKKGEHDLKAMLDIAQNDLLLTGVLAKIIARYDLPDGTLYLRTIPYTEK